MATKRAADAPAKRGRKSRKVNLVPAVVDALTSAEVLPQDLRTVFEAALPLVFSANKADRHAYEAEIVDQAEKALASVQTALEQGHAAALEKQNEVIAPSEHAKRTAAKKEAEAGFEAAKTKLEACKEAQATAKKAVHDAHSAVKAAEKDANKAEKEMQGLADKKTNLSEVLVNEFVALVEGKSDNPAGKKAVKKLEAIGKEYSIDDTLIQTLPITCKKDPTLRTEFEAMMFSGVKAAIEKQIENMTQKLTELEPAKAEKLTAVATARGNLEQVEASLAGMNEEISGLQAASKEANKEVGKADNLLYNIWADMKQACDAQDVLAKEVKNLKDSIWTAFQQLKEKEPEPEPVEEPETPEKAAEEAAPEEADAEVAAEA